MLLLSLPITLISKGDSENFGDKYFTICFFQKGTGHMLFKSLDLVKKMNAIITIRECQQQEQREKHTASHPISACFCARASQTNNSILDGI